VRRVLRRGLEADPAKRFPSMDALLAELGHDPAVARRRWAAGGVAAVLAGLAIWGFARGGGGGAEETRCRGGEERLAGVWDDPVRAGVERAFAASRRVYAADTFARVRRLLDDRAAAMTTMRRDACEATHVRGEQSTELLDRRVACLDQRLAETAALTRLFADQPEPAVVDKAVEAAMTLPAVAQCADAEALLVAVPPPADEATRAAVAGLRERVAAAEAVGKAGRYQQMHDLAVAAVREAALLDYPPLLAEARTREAEALGRLGKFAAAEKIWLQVVDSAARAHDDRLLAKAWSQLIFVQGYHGKRFAEAGALEPVAAAAVLRAGNPPEEAGYVQSTIAAARMAAGKYAEAEERYARLVAMWEQHYGAEHIHVATALTNLGHAQQQNGHTEQALVSAQRAVAIRQKLFGPEHPAVAISIGTRGTILSDLGRDQEAMVDFRRTLEIREKALGPDHPLVATSRLNLGMKLRLLGRHEEAQTQLESSLALYRKLGNQEGVAGALLALGQLHHKALRETEALASVSEALAIQEAKLGPDHPEVADTLKIHANILRALGRFDEAERGLKRSLKILETKMGADNPWLSGSLQDLGFLAMKRERWDEAAGYYTRAIAIGEKAYAPDNPGTLRLYMQLARARGKQGRQADVDALIERTAAALPAKVTGSMEISWVAWDVGLALWSRNRGDDRARGRALVERCLAELRTAKASAGDIAETEAWLAKHPSPQPR
jgi:serine/threonine-protein kinase